MSLDYTVMSTDLKELQERIQKLPVVQAEARKMAELVTRMGGQGHPLGLPFPLRALPGMGEVLERICLLLITDLTEPLARDVLVRLGSEHDPRWQVVKGDVGTIKDQFKVHGPDHLCRGSTRPGWSFSWREEEAISIMGSTKARAWSGLRNQPEPLALALLDAFEVRP